MIFKKNQSKRFHITSIIIGVLFVTVGTIIYSLLYKNKVEEFSYENMRLRAHVWVGNSLCLP